MRSKQKTDGQELEKALSDENVLRRVDVGPWTNPAIDEYPFCIQYRRSDDLKTD
jgi:hypothetical protein